MMADGFDVLDWLSGITSFVFEKAVLVNVAYEQGVNDITDYADITESIRDHCEIALLTKAFYGPNTMASSTHTHGAFTKSVGQQQVTADVRERILQRIKFLASKYEDEDIAAPEIYINEWVDEHFV